MTILWKAVWQDEVQIHASCGRSQILIERPVEIAVDDQTLDEVQMKLQGLATGQWGEGQYEYKFVFKLLKRAVLKFGLY